MWSTRSVLYWNHITHMFGWFVAKSVQVSAELANVGLLAQPGWGFDMWRRPGRKESFQGICIKSGALEIWFVSLWPVYAYTISRTWKIFCALQFPKWNLKNRLPAGTWLKVGSPLFVSWAVGIQNHETRNVQQLSCRIHEASTKRMFLFNISRVEINLIIPQINQITSNKHSGLLEVEQKMHWRFLFCGIGIPGNEVGTCGVCPEVPLSGGGACRAQGSSTQSRWSSSACGAKCALQTSASSQEFAETDSFPFFFCSSSCCWSPCQQVVAAGKSGFPELPTVSAMMDASTQTLSGISKQAQKLQQQMLDVQQDRTACLFRHSYKEEQDWTSTYFLYMYCIYC